MKNDFSVDGWISVLDRLPTADDTDENGKVLIYRKMNDAQRGMSKSIFDWDMVKNCDPAETYWRSLPPQPNNTLNKPNP